VSHLRTTVAIKRSSTDTDPNWGTETMSTTTKTFAPNDTATPADPRSVVEARNAAGTTGRTTVADVVVQKIAGRAAREISGVYDFGGGTARTFGAITERIPGGRASTSRGVTVEVGEKQAAIDLDVVVEYGVPIAQLAQSIRRNVISAVEQLTGLDVVEVNINVNDLHLPEDEVEVAVATEPRVQ
jgi:uncharacterized alkaline shock family protein YloU